MSAWCREDSGILHSETFVIHSLEFSNEFGASERSDCNTCGLRGARHFESAWHLTYDHANRLIGVSNAQSSATFAYNGLGDRLQQTIGGVTTQYTLDINNSLSQVLADGTDRYLYGMGRIAQQTPGGWQYFLPDPLGSARQLTDAAGALVLAQSFDPYGGLFASQRSTATP